MDKQISNFAKNLRVLRNRAGFTQKELADKIGVTEQSVYMWERGGIDRPRNRKTLQAICEVLDTTEDALLSYFSASTPIPAAPFTHTAPLIGNVAAGEAREAIEHADEFHGVPDEFAEQFPGGFFLRVAGDSMNLVIPDGAFVFIDGVPTNVRTGDIAAVKVNGDDATIKRVQLFDNLIILVPESTNPEHKRRVIDETDPDAPYVRMLGRAVWVDYALVGM